MRSSPPRARHAEAGNGNGAGRSDGHASSSLEADGLAESVPPAAPPAASSAGGTSGDPYGFNQLSCGSAVYSGYDTSAGGVATCAEAGCASSDLFGPKQRVTQENRGIGGEAVEATLRLTNGAVEVVESSAPLLVAAPGAYFLLRPALGGDSSTRDTVANWLADRLRARLA